MSAFQPGDQVLVNGGQVATITGWFPENDLVGYVIKQGGSENRFLSNISLTRLQRIDNGVINQSDLGDEARGLDEVRDGVSNTQEASPDTRTMIDNLPDTVLDVELSDEARAKLNADEALRAEGAITGPDETTRQALAKLAASQPAAPADFAADRSARDGSDVSSSGDLHRFADDGNPHHGDDLTDSTFLSASAAPEEGEAKDEEVTPGGEPASHEAQSDSEPSADSK